MLFNGDLFDVISEVHFAKIVNANISNSKLFRYLHEYRMEDKAYEKFMNEVSSTLEIMELGRMDPEVLEWLLEVSYYYVTSNTVAIFDSYVFTLALMADDRDKIAVLAETNMYSKYSFLLTHGTLAQAKWLYSINPRMFDQSSSAGLNSVCELELMEFIHSISSVKVYIREWSELVCYNPVKKREIATLEFIISKNVPQRNLQYYFDDHCNELFKLIKKICKYGDDAFLQWLMINYPEEFKEAVYDNTYQDNIETMVIAKCSLPTLKMYIELMRVKIMSTVYNNHIINMNYLSTIAL